MALQFSEDLSKLWEDVRSDAEATNWLILEVGVDNKTVEAVGKGSDGYEGFIKTIAEPTKVYYGVLRCTAVDMDSRRTKIIFVVWLGEKVPPTKKAKAGIFKSSFEKFFHGFHVVFTTSAVDQITKDDFVKKLDVSTGAHKPKSYEF